MRRSGISNIPRGRRIGYSLYVLGELGQFVENLDSLMGAGFRQHVRRWNSRSRYWNTGELASFAVE